MPKRFALLWVMLSALLVLPISAREAPPTAQDPVLEARVMAIAEELRCLVCQNETIAASHADLAVDLRKQIRLQLQQGRSTEQILDFMVQRYGDFVLYRPPFKASTALLWAGPFLLLVFAGGTLVLQIKKRRRGLRGAELSEEDRAKARKILAEETETS